MKRFLKVSIVLMLALFAAVSLFACTEEEEAEHVHEYGEWEVLQEPSCTVPGQKKRTCTAGDNEETEEIPATGHTEETLAAVEPDCTHTGLTEGKRCSVCKEILVSQKIRAALGHSFSDWTVVTVATCTADGERIRVCDVCGIEEKETIEKTDHTYASNGLCKICGSALEETEGLLYISQKDASLIVTGYEGSSAYVVIPEWHDGHRVTAISAYAFSHKPALKAVTVPKTVTSIGLAAFTGCTHLEEISLPDSVSEIGMSAFYGCSSLASFKIPNSLKDISYELFSNCTALTSISIPSSVESIGAYAFRGCTNLKNISLPDSLTGIGDEAFSGCDNLTYTEKSAGYYLGNESNPYVLFVQAQNTVGSTYEIVENTRIIYSYVFSRTRGFETITIPSTVIYICPNAFFGCALLEQIVFEEDSRLVGIGASAFSDCGSLRSFEVPAGVTSIGYLAFGNCNALSSLKVAEGNVTYEAKNNCIIEKNTKTLIVGCMESVVPDDGSVTGIGEGAFYYCAGLTEIVLPASVQFVRSVAFSGCENITYISGSDYVAGIVARQCGSIEYTVNISTGSSVSGGMFKDCVGLVDLEMAPTVTTIESNAFEGCVSLTKVRIPETVTTVGSHAFEGCTELSVIIILGQSVDIASDAFFGCEKVKEIKLPAAAIESVTFRDNLEKVEITNGEAIADSAFKGFDSLLCVTLPRTLLSIGASAFEGCENLSEVHVEDLSSWCKVHFANSTANPIYYAQCLYLGEEDRILSLTIPDDVTDISNFAFYNGRTFTKLTIPETVASIGDSAFYGCIGLDTIELPTRFLDRIITKKSLREVKITSGDAIADYAFSGCDQLLRVELPNTVRTIGAYAFQECAVLQSVTVPSSVTAVYNSAFYGCVGLKEIHIGSIESWCRIDFTNNTANPLYYGKDLYLGDELIEKLVIPESVLNITNYVFYNCTSIKEIKIYNTIQSLRTYTFTGCTAIETVELPISVLSYFPRKSWVDVTLTDGTVIPESIFADCDSITRIILPETVTDIAENAFSGCVGLTKITLPDSVKNIAQNAFSGCPNIEEVSLPTDALESVIFKESLKKVVISSGTTITEDAFSNCRRLEQVTIAETVTTIEENAFLNCTGITELVVPNSVTAVADTSFRGCSGIINVTAPLFILDNLKIKNENGRNIFNYLQNVVITDGTTIGAGYFAAQINIRTVSVSAVTSIGNNAFNGCTMLEEISLSNSVTSIGKGAFGGCIRLRSISLPVGVSTIEEELFSGCTRLESITMSQTVSSIGQKAFSGCSALTTIEIPSLVTELASGTFYGCSALGSMTLPFVGNSVSNDENTHFGFIFGATSYAGGERVNIPSQYSGGSGTTYYVPGGLKNVTVTSGNIRSGAFENCAMIEKIVLPSNATSIGDRAFKGCAGLKNIDIPETVISIGNDAFNNCAQLVDIVIPDAVTSLSQGVFYGCDSIESMTLPFIGKSSDPTEGTKPFEFIFSSTDESEVNDAPTWVPDSLKTVSVTGDYPIPDNAFKNCAYIETIMLNENITSIGKSAFNKCSSLTGLVLPTSLTSVDEGAFTDCEALTEIVIPSGITTLSDSLFAGCLYLVDIELNDGLETIGKNVFDGCERLVLSSLPSTVTSIGEYAFNKCYSITEMTLPEAITVIDVGLFYDCRNLATLPISESVTSIRKDAFSGCTSLFGSEDEYGYYLGNEQKPKKVLLKAKSNVRNFVADENVEFICNAAFGDCRNLESLSIPFVGAKEGETESREEKCFGYFFKGSKVDETYQEITQFNMKVYVMPSLTKVTVTKGVIGEKAFAGFSSLTQIVLGDSVTSIESAAFKGCSSLTEFTIPFVGQKQNLSSSSKTVLGYIFGTENYSGSRKITQSYDYGATTKYYITESLKLVTITGGTGDYTLPYGAFYNCDFIESITLSEKVIGAKAQAFGKCKSISTVQYDGDVDSWCAMSFDDAEANPIYYACELNVKDPETSGYKKVVDLTIPGTVQTVSKYTFYNCGSLLSLTLEEGVTKIDANAFNSCTHLRFLTVPNGLSTIGTNAFQNCYRLVEIDDKSSLSLSEKIGAQTYGYVAYYAKNVGAEIESKVEQDNNGFVIYDGSVLIDYSGADGEVVIPSAVTEFNQYALYDHDEITSVVFGSEIVKAGLNAFYECSNLEDVRYSSDIQHWFDIEFINNASNPLYCAHTLHYLENESYKLLESLTIPEGVTEIKNYAFYGCSDLTDVTIGSEVAAIGEAVIGGCVRLQQVSIPESFESFGKYFGRTSYADSIACGEYYLPKSLTTVTVTGGVNIVTNAFKNCKGLETIVLPDTLLNIESGAFNGCTELRTLAIPGSLTDLGKNVFDGCVSLVMNEWLGGYYLGNEDNPYFVLVDIGDRLCSEKLNRNNPVAKLSLEYCDCDPFSGTSEELSDHAAESIDSDAVAAVEDISRDYATFLNGYTITEELLTFRPTGENYNNYAQFFDKAKTMFYSVNGAIQKNVKYVPNESTVVGVNKPFEVKFEDFYYYKAVENPSYDGIEAKLYFEYIEEDDLYQVSQDPEILQNKTYYVHTKLEYSDYMYILAKLFGYYSKDYRVVENAVEAEIGRYYEYKFIEDSDSWEYRLTDDTVIDNSKVYYEIPSAAQLFTERAQFIADAYLQKRNDLGEEETLNKTYFDGAFVTENGTLVFPYAFQNSVTDTVYVYIFVDSQGMISAWINDIPTAMEAVNFRDDDRAETTIEVFGRCKLFKAAKKHVSKFSVHQNTYFISYGVFNGCSSLMKLTVPFVGANRTAESAREDTFFGYLFGHEEYEKSKTIVQKFRVNSQEEYEFRIPSMLNTVSVQGGDVIMNGAFYNFDNIIQVSIAGIKTINDYAFYNCYKLIEIYNQAGLSLRITKDNNGERVENATYGYIANYAENIFKKEGGSKITETDGIITFRNGADVILLSYVGTDDSLVLTDVTEIYMYAFYNNTDVKSILIPDSVEKIGNYAFSGCDAYVSWDRYTTDFSGAESLSAHNIDLRYNSNNVFETKKNDGDITSQQAVANVNALAKTEYGKSLAYLNVFLDESLGSTPITEETTRFIWFDPEQPSYEDSRALFAYESYFTRANNLFNAAYDPIAWSDSAKTDAKYTMYTSAVVGISSPFLVSFKYANNLKDTTPLNRGDYLTVLSRLFGFESVEDFINKANTIATVLSSDLDADDMTKYDGAINAYYNGDVTVATIDSGFIEIKETISVGVQKGYVLSYVFSAEDIEKEVFVNFYVENDGKMTVWISNAEAAFTMVNQNWWCSQKVEYSPSGLPTVEYCDCDIFVRLNRDNNNFTVEKYSTHSGSAYIEQAFADSFDSIASTYGEYVGLGQGAEKEAKYAELLAAIDTAFSGVHTDACKNLGFTTGSSRIINIKNGLEEDVTKVANLFGFEDKNNFIEAINNISDRCRGFNATTDTLQSRLVFDGAIYTESGYFILPYAFIRLNKKSVLALVFVSSTGVNVWISDITQVDNILETKERMTAYGRCMLFETPYDPAGEARVIKTFGRDDLYRMYTTAEITKIEKSAFNGYLGTTLVLPDTIEAIDSYAFANCVNLEHLFIPETISSFGTAVLQNSDKLKYNNQSQTEDFAGWYLGNGINQFIILAKPGFASSSITLATSTVFIADNAFEATDITGVTIPASVKSIGKNVFNGCTLLKTVTFEGTELRSIGDYAFKNTILESISLPESLESIGEGVFNNCLKLEDLTIPFVGADKNATVASGETLFGYIFGRESSTDASKTNRVEQWYGQESTQWSICYIPVTLKKVTVLGGNVRYGAFSNVFKESTENQEPYWIITFGDNIGTIGENAFDGCVGIKEVRISSVDRWLGISFDNAKANPVYYSKCLYVGSADAYTELTSLTLGNEVDHINAYAFYNCVDLASLDVANINIRIGSQAFEGCLLLNNFIEAGGGRYFGVSGNDYALLVSLLDAPDQVTSFTVNPATTAISEGVFKNCVNLTSVTLPSALATIENELFSGCTSLTSIDLPTVTEIKKNAFFGCSGLTSITLPSNLATIGEGAFRDCTSLATVNFNDILETIGKEAFRNLPITSLTIPDSVTTIGESAFRSCSDITEVTIGSGVTEIGNDAFLNCNSITSVNYTSDDVAGWFGIDFKDQYANPLFVSTGENKGKLKLNGVISDIEFTVPGGTTEIGYQFTACTNLKTITLPTGVLSVGPYAFYGCTSLTSATMPDTLTSIGEYAFYGCSNESFTTFTVPVNVSKIGSYAFMNCYSLTEIEFADHNKILSLADGLFYNCENVSELVVVKSVVSIGKEVFYGCTGTIVWDDKDDPQTSVDVIEDETFSGYLGASIEIQDGITEIGARAFKNCKNITSISLPASVASIGAEAFYGCYSLTEMTLPFVGTSGSVTQASSTTVFGAIFGSFGSIPGKTAPREVTQKFNSSSQDTYTLPGGLTSVTILGGSILYGAFYGCDILQNVSLLAGVTSIGSHVFYNCSALTELTLPFVGSQILTESDNNQYTLGYIFGTAASSDPGIQQYYRYTPTSTMSASYYFPTTLTTVTILGGNILYGAFYNCNNLTSITLPNGITSIGDRAFYGCGKLASLIIPDDVTSIGQYAFYNCSMLTSITVPDKVESLGQYAFYNSGLQSITLPLSVKNISADAFYSCTSLKTVDYNGTVDDWSVITFGNEYANPLRAGLGNLYFLSNNTCICRSSALKKAGFTEITALVLGASKVVAKINDYAFAYYERLTSVSIPATVQTVSGKAFLGCAGIESFSVLNENDSKYCTEEGVLYRKDETGRKTELVIYPSAKSGTEYEIAAGAMKIGEYAFYTCPGLSKITLTADVTTIGTYAFAYCSGLRTVDLGYATDLSVIDPYAFYNCQNAGFTTITLPISVTSIGANAFQGCTHLQSVMIGEGSLLETINNYAFAGATALTSINLENATSLITLGSSAFSGCNNAGFTSITLPESLTSIGGSAFANCSRLADIAIPKNVTTIGSSAFVGCSGLRSVTFADGSKLTSIGSSAFRSCNNSNFTSIVIPDTVTSIGNLAFNGCSHLEEMTLPRMNNNNSYFGYIFNGNSSNSGLPASLTKVTVTGGTSNYSLPANAFYSCSTLVSITLGEKVTGIGNYAFAQCVNLTTVDLSNATYLTLIGAYAFQNCQNAGFTSISIPGRVTSIGNYAFNGCNKLTQIEMKASDLSTTEMIINPYAFSSCSGLTFVTLPKKLTIIGDRAFNNCSNLTGVDFTLAEKLTSIGNYAFNNCNKLYNLYNFVNATRLTTIGAYAFYYCFRNTQHTGVTLTLPENVSTINIYAFQYCTYISWVNFTRTNRLETIGSYAFANCTNLRNIVIPDTVTNIGGFAFSGCNNLNSITLPKVYNTRFGYIFNGTSSNTSSIPSALRYVTITGGTGNYTLPNNAFNGSNYLTSITLGSGVTTIAASAFANCTGLRNIVIPDTVTSISGSAFNGCNNLQSMTLPFVGGSRSWTYAFGYIFNGNTGNNAGVPANLKHVTITGGTSDYTLPDNAFKGSTNIETVSLGENVTSIGNSAFVGCTKLTSVSFAENCTSIGSYAFRNCSAFTSFTVPDTVTSIGSSAFDGCSHLEEMTLPRMSSYSSYFGYIFNGSESNSGLPTSLIKVTVTGGNASYTIPSNAFNGCNTLVSITLGVNVTGADENAFGNCANLSQVRYDGTIEDWCNIDFSAATANPLYSGHYLYIRNTENTETPTYDYCYLLSLPAIVKQYAFYGCYSLAGITVPSSMSTVSIGTDAFKECCALVAYAPEVNNGSIDPDVENTIKNAMPDNDEGKKKYNSISTAISINTDGFILYTYDTINTYRTILGYVGTSVSPTIPSQVKKIGAYAFYKKNVTSITIPSTLVSVNEYAFKDCVSLASVDTSNASNLTRIGVGVFYGCTALTSVTIPSRVVSIETSAFYGCTALTSVTFSGTSLTTIGDNAFDGCTNLQNVSFTYATNLRSIGDYAFQGCSALTSLDLSYATYLQSIGDFAFHDCALLATITFNTTSNSQLTSIGTGAFSGCRMSSIIIPNNVTSMGEGVFVYCDYLATVTVPFVGDSRDNPTQTFGYLFRDWNAHEVRGLSNVTSMTVTVTGGNSAYSIPDSGFMYCSLIRSLILGNNVTRIGDNALIGCTGLAYLTVSANLEYVGNNALGTGTSDCGLWSQFNNTNNALNSVYYFDENRRILCKPVAQNYTSVTIHDNTRVIYQNAFKNNTYLTSVAIPSNVKNIGFYAFYGCSSLKTVTYSSLAAWTSIDFYDGWANPIRNANLEKVVAGDKTYRMKNSVTVSFNANGGSNAPSSQTVTPTNGLTYPTTIPTMSGYIFRGWTDSPTGTTPYDFTQAPYGNITLYAMWANISGYSSATVANICSNYNSSGNAFSDNSISGSTEQFFFTALKGGTYTINFKAIKSNRSYSHTLSINVYINGSSTSTYNYSAQAATSSGSSYTNRSITLVAGDVVRIAYSATSYNTGTTYKPNYVYPSVYLFVSGGSYPNEGGRTSSVTLNLSSITKIGSYAFATMNTLESVTLGSSLTSIGDGAFCGCYNLSAPNLSYATNLTSIGAYAFYNCHNSNFTSITIPDSVTSIGGSVFYGCNYLTTITLPFVGSSRDSTYSFGYVFNGNNGDNSSNFPANVSNMTVTITGGGADYTLPANAFSNCTKLRTITLGSNVKEIGSSAFYGCTNLYSARLDGVTSIGNNAFQGCTSFRVFSTATSTSTIIPSTVTVIGNYAFSGCNNSSFTSITVPNSVTSIGNYAFQGCNNLTLVSMSSATSLVSIGNYAFNNCTRIGSVYMPSSGVLESIGECAFQYCSSLSSIIIPDSVTSIGRRVFYGCNNLATITLPFVGDGTDSHTFFGYIFNGGDSYGNGSGFPSANMTVTVTGASYNIPADAFKGVGLQKVIFKSNILTIGDRAFENCTGLTTLDFTYATNLTSIGSQAFHGCSALTSLNLTNATNLLSIDFLAFQRCAKLATITFNTTNSRLTSIGTGAFSFSGTDSSSRLTTITIPNSVTSIGEGAFLSSSYLATITLPFVGEKRNDPDEVFSYLFSHWNSHTVSYPSSYLTVTVTGGSASGYILPANAFNGCTKLSSITLGNNVKFIGYQAFYGCSNLRTLTLPFVGDGTSDHTNVGYIFNGGTSNTTNMPTNNLTVTITGGGADYYLPANAFNGCTKLYSITLSSNVKSIGESAFKGCSSLSSVSLPSGTSSKLTTIGWEAFSGCAFSSITIPGSVTDIGEKVFYGCSNLRTLTLPFVGGGRNSQSNFGYIFNGGTSNTVDLPSLVDNTMVVTITGGSATYTLPANAFKDCVKLKTVTLNNVQIIGESAFSGCENLTSITLSNSLKEIKEGAFKNCSALTSLTIPNNVTSIGEGALNGCKNLTTLTIPFVGKGSNLSAADASEEHLFGYIFGTETYDGGYEARSYYDANSSEYVQNIIPSKLTTLTINGGNMGYGAFEKVTSLKNVTIKTNNIAESAFSGCSGLTTVSIQNNAQTVSDNAFRNCVNLTSVTMTNVSTIGANAFLGCASLTTLTVPNSVTSIGEGAFNGCSALTEITLPFVGGSSSATEASRSTLFGYVFGTASYTGGTKVTQYFSAEGKEGYYIPTGLKKITISGGKIYEGAFSNMTEIEIVVLGDAITSIARGAFNNNQSLKELTIPFVGYERRNESTNCENSLFGYIFSSTAMENGSYTEQIWYWNSELDHGALGSYIPNSLEKVTVTGGKMSPGTFDRCNYIKEIVITSGSITEIPEEAFMDMARLEKITIPSTVTKVEKCIRNMFTSSTTLTDIYFRGTKSEWQSFGTTWKEDYSGHITVHCSNGDLEFD